VETVVIALTLVYNWAVQNSVVFSVNETAEHRKVFTQRRMATSTSIDFRAKKCCQSTSSEVGFEVLMAKFHSENF
jgi:hypothetical protein